MSDHSPPNVLLVAIDELDDVVGFTAVHPREGEMFLLFVHPKHAGYGVGHALLDAAQSALRGSGCREAFLYTHEENERALAVYEAAGYRPDGTNLIFAASLAGAAAGKTTVISCRLRSEAYSPVWLDRQ